MSADVSPEVTRCLEELSSGDSSAADRLFPLVYSELRQRARGMMQRENAGHTLQATALVHEAFLKLVGQQKTEWNGRTHFFAVGAQAMRRILVDHARTRRREKRGGGKMDLSFEETLNISADSDSDVLAVDEAIEALRKVDEGQAKIVELRFFGGMTMEEIAVALGMSKRSAEAEWTMIRAWLRKYLSDLE